VGPPALRQHLDLKDAVQQLTVVPIRHIQPMDVGDGDAMGVRRDPLDGVLGANLPLAQHRQVEAAAAALQEAADDIVPAEPQTQLVAG
jgi:hypothetical protein